MLRRLLLQRLDGVVVAAMRTETEDTGVAVAVTATVGHGDVHTILTTTTTTMTVRQSPHPPLHRRHLTAAVAATSTAQVGVHHPSQ